MTNIVEARALVKNYGNFKALDGVDLTIPSGAISGLIGPNGAGKTTTLKALIGLCDVEGELNVAGRDPREARHKLMEDVCFIADVGILPKWLKVSQVIDYVEAVHPKFHRARAEKLLSTTEIPANKRIKELSKGMVTQLHLALVMAIDVRLLVLDEPTLGLDIIYRKEFYDRLLNEYYDGNCTIIISTHQVEEVEALLSHLMFINKGKIVLDAMMNDLAETYTEVIVDPQKIERADSLNPIHIRELLGKKCYTYESVSRTELESLGECLTPSVADLFVAKMKETRHG
ncbi:MAG TPA: multidrug ABC transporter ATP-binding protein [Gammaproteobacteria bacterium]|jgi:ABC-2 type transport system ATP-binding protein|nr:ABC transporter ATP-binding protein [Gammaproteobacteria bacterium]MDP6732505.1 ABC transporter ATP-binding protein [Gammaproteobacteria bacterium]HAJ77081.1 multidrug ABC transporter ATP-binding protein [Gammaproteobacteria bacterium]|tara:strand:+ start:1208 stop:2068 length:861 start_codon:yes stop_codon:yes gene_type:complete